MANFVFILCLAGLIGLLLCWSFRHLPQERWQILGAVPRIKLADGNWQGVNLTYYGLLTANACVFAAILFFVLLTSAGVLAPIIFLVTAMVFSICVPASRLIARWVEDKAFTASAGGLFLSVFCLFHNRYCAFCATDYRCNSFSINFSYAGKCLV